MRTLAIIGIVVSAIGITLGVHTFYDTIISFGDFPHNFNFHPDIIKPFHGGILTTICSFFLAFSIIVLKKSRRPEGLKPFGDQ